MSFLWFIITFFATNPIFLQCFLISGVYHVVDRHQNLLYDHGQSVVPVSNRVVDRFHTIETTEKCGNSSAKTLTEGLIVSPNYPENYTNRLRCHWYIRTAPKHSIALEFRRFQTELYRDVLAVYDGNSSTGRLIGEFSGAHIPWPVMSATNELFLVFTADELRTGKGFSIRSKIVENGCGGELTELDDAIYSPGYPSDYSELSCIWNITVPLNRSILLMMSDFNSLSHFGTLSVYESANYVPGIGVIPLKDSLLGHFSGKNLTQNKLISTRNQLFVELKTNNKTENGFKIGYLTKKRGMYSEMIIAVPNAIIKTASNGSIRSSLYRGTEVTEVLHFDPFIAIYFNPQINQIIFDTNKEISYNLKGMGRPQSLTVDPFHSHVYWIDIESNTIKVFDFSVKDIQFVYTVCNVTNGTPVDLLYNAYEERLVWSYAGMSPGIMFAEPDGSHQTVLYKSGFKQPFHLTADYRTECYYFVDITEYSLYSIDFSGRNEMFYFKSQEFFSSITGMDVDGGDVYLSNEHMIYRITEFEFESHKEMAEILYKTNTFHNTNESKNIYVFKPQELNRRTIFGFKLLFTLNTVMIYSHKSKNCSHLSLSTGHGYRCLCPSGMHLRDKHKCIQLSQQMKSEAKDSEDSLTVINTLLIALIFVLMLVFVVSLKIKSFKTNDKNDRNNGFRRTRLRLMSGETNEVNLDGVRDEDDL